jgi:hypothetical protein
LCIFYIACRPIGVNWVIFGSKLFYDSNEHVGKNKTVFIASNEIPDYVNCHFNCRGYGIGIFKDFEGNGYGMFQGTIPALSWRDWGKL